MRRYPSGYLKININTNTKRDTNLFIYNAVIPAKYLRAMDAYSL